MEGAQSGLVSSYSADGFPALVKKDNINTSRILCLIQIQINNHYLTSNKMLRTNKRVFSWSPVLPVDLSKPS